jgi:hypothetical protein
MRSDLGHGPMGRELRCRHSHQGLRRLESDIVSSAMALECVPSLGPAGVSSAGPLTLPGASPCHRSTGGSSPGKPPGQ